MVVWSVKVWMRDGRDFESAWYRFDTEEEAESYYDSTKLSRDVDQVEMYKGELGDDGVVVNEEQIKMKSNHYWDW